MKEIRRYVIAVMLSGLASSAVAGGWGVGSGGDALRLAFVKAREHAAHLTLRLQPTTIPASVDPYVRQWLLDHHAELAADITTSEHEWVLEEKPTCAWTQLSRAAVVQLSFPTCRTRLDSFDEAAQLLVHEAVHHFGIEDEAFADQVALAIYDAWRLGTTEWTATANMPDPRSQHVAVWTGSEILVHGGIVQQGGRGQSAEVTNSFYAFDPEKNSWRELSSKGAPFRFGHVAVWASDRLFVWGGYVLRGQSKVWQNNGAVYDPALDSWSELRTPFGPAELADLTRTVERPVQQVVFTGKELFVFGGMPVDGRVVGGLYNPLTQRWRAISNLGAPFRTYGHSAVSTGEKVIVFGGVDLEGNLSNRGAIFNPSDNSWTPLMLPGSPPPREGHTAVYTGRHMIVFGGYESAPDAIGVGGVFDVQSNTWRSIETEAVLGRTGHSAVWNGSEMLIFGGRSKRLRSFRAVSAYDPIKNSWRVIEGVSSPEPRYLHAAAWTGKSLVILGGVNQSGEVLGSGGVFYP